MNSNLERARGVLWGQAVGDALGTTVEFERAALIAEIHPQGVREIVGKGPFELERGQITDDTELALCLARSLSERHSYDDEDVVRRYVRWCNSNPPDCGGTTRTAFGSKPPTKSPWAPVVRERALRDSQANGALMRVSPLGVFGSKLDPEELHRLAGVDARWSHPHDVCVAANQVFVFAIAHALTTGKSGKAVFEATLDFAKHTQSCTEVLPTLQLATRALPDDAFTNMGWVRHALQCAFHQLLHATSFEEALVQVIGLGGDTDTNGCITGALLGSVFGASAIPSRWIAPVKACEPLRPREYWCGDLDELAEALLQR